jgi:hypothetical protein
MKKYLLLYPYNLLKDIRYTNTHMLTDDINSYTHVLRKTHKNSLKLSQFV